MEDLTFLDLEVLTCLWVSTTRQRIDYFYLNEAVSMNEHRAYLSVPIGDGISYSILCILHISPFSTDMWIRGS